MDANLNTAGQKYVQLSQSWFVQKVFMGIRSLGWRSLHLVGFLKRKEAHITIKTQLWRVAFDSRKNEYLSRSSSVRTGPWVVAKKQHSLIASCGRNIVWNTSEYTHYVCIGWQETKILQVTKIWQKRYSSRTITLRNEEVKSCNLYYWMDVMAHPINGALGDLGRSDQGTWRSVLGFSLQSLQHAEHVQR